MREEVSVNNKLILSIIIKNDTFDQVFAKWGSHHDDNRTMSNDGSTIRGVYFPQMGKQSICLLKAHSSNAGWMRQLTTADNIPEGAQQAVVIPTVGKIDVANIGVVAALIVGDSAIIGEGAGENRFEKS
uniref:Uncharacterized protein n=1 Tax=Romanomermis culicivorax TaxID=13658 RepID=A0A915JMF6_ROMCU